MVRDLDDLASPDDLHAGEDPPVAKSRRNCVHPHVGLGERLDPLLQRFGKHDRHATMMHAPAAGCTEGRPTLLPWIPSTICPQTLGAKSWPPSKPRSV